MNGSNFWGSLAPYGDILSLFKWNIYKRSSYFPFKNVIIDNSLQNTLGEKKNAKCHLETFLFHYLPTCTAIILSFMKLLIFLINIQFEQGEDITNVTIRCQ